MQTTDGDEEVMYKVSNLSNQEKGLKIFSGEEYPFKCIRTWINFHVPDVLKDFSFIFYVSPLKFVACTTTRFFPAKGFCPWLLIVLLVSFQLLGTGIQGSQIQCILPNRFYSFTMRHPLMVVDTADCNLIVFNLQNPLVTFSSNKMNQ